MSTPEVQVNGQTRPFGAIAAAHDGSRLAPRPGPDRGQGRLRRRGVRRLRDHGRAPRRTTGGRHHRVGGSINACLIPAAGLDGQEVLTAEGLGTPTTLHPVQHEMAVRGGSQCGYCTPGFVCSMAAEYYRAGRARPAGTTDAAGGSIDGRAADPNAAGRRGRRRARSQRLRPARAERQPVPLHRLPADQGRRLRARRAGTPTTRSRAPAVTSHRLVPARPGSPSDDRRVRAARGPGRRPCSCWPSAPRRCSSPGRRTGASRSTSAASGRRSWSRSTSSPSCAS